MHNDASCGHDSTSAPQRLQDTTFWLLGRASRLAQQLTSERLAQTGMRHGFYGVLATLDEFGPAAQAEIGRRLRVDPSDMVAILNDLEREGYIERDRDPNDKRRNTITLTRNGQSALTNYDQAIAQAQDSVMAGLSTADRDKLISLLKALIDTDKRPPTGENR